MHHRLPQGSRRQSSLYGIFAAVLLSALTVAPSPNATIGGRRRMHHDFSEETRRSGGPPYMQHFEANYLHNFEMMSAASYQTDLAALGGGEIDAVGAACQSGEQAPATMTNCELPTGSVTAAEAQTVCSDAACRCVVPPGTSLLLDDSLVVSALVVRGELHWADQDAADSTAPPPPRWLCSGYIVAEGNGVIRVRATGSTASRAAAIVYIRDNGVAHEALGKRVLGAVHNSESTPGLPLLELAGRPLQRTWSLLAAPLAEGEQVMQLMHDAEAMGWRAGDRIAIAPTVYMSQGDAQSFVIESLSGSTVQLSRDSLPDASDGANQLYLAEGRVRAEVINLERTVLVTGDDFRHEECGTGECTCTDSRSTCTLGLHTVAMGAATLRVTHSRLEKCGQRGISGKYCVHMHYMGESGRDSLVHGNAIENSQQRGVVIHETHLSTVSENTLYNVRGAGYYIEDGNEMHNTLSYNVAICPFRLDGPMGGCTVPGTDNGEADTSLNHAGIWSLAHYNHFTGNRMANSFNGLLFHSSFAPHGKGVAEGQVCTPHAAFGRIIGNTNHGHGRFGHYWLVNVYPRDVTQSLTTNGMTTAGCEAFDETGEDRGLPVPVVDGTDYHNNWMGAYNLGDVQYQREHQPDSLNTMYWKETKNMADGCSAHVLDSVFGHGNLALPDARGTLLFERCSFRGRVTFMANHHCGVGVTGLLCNPQYLLRPILV
jgi:hypothetical protein